MASAIHNMNCDVLIMFRQMGEKLSGALPYMHTVEMMVEELGGECKFKDYRCRHVLEVP